MQAGRRVPADRKVFLKELEKIYRMEHPNKAKELHICIEKGKRTRSHFGNPSVVTRLGSDRMEALDLLNTNILIIVLGKIIW